MRTLNLRQPRSVPRALRRFFWMDERAARAREQAIRPGRPGWEDFEFGRAVMRDAIRLFESADGRSAALVLFRSAAARMVRAQLARAQIPLESTVTADQCWARLSGHARVASVVADITDEESSLVQLALAPQGEAWLARLSKDQRTPAALALRKLARGLAAPIEREIRALRNVLLVRWLRIGVAALALVLVAWRPTPRLAGRRPGPNLAFHRLVTASSSFQLEPTNPAQLVDGVRTNLGFHTNRGPNQYVIIDLGSVQRISRVDVYNRASCCGERAVPLRIETSRDGKSYQQVAIRNEPFDLWQAWIRPTKGRYVRLTDLRNDFFHLSEVEVY
jgi:hypothetical protein